VQAEARDAFQVLDWIISRHVHEYLDVAGRPIGEGRAGAFQQVQTEMRTCPYGGSRYHHAKPMNVTALQQMPDWQHVLTILSWLSQRYRAARQTEITTYNDLAQVTSAGVFLVDFLVLRQHQPLRSHEIPVLISGLYKACLGLQLAYLPERFADETAPAHLPDAAGFYAYVEENELLIGEAEVCAGTPAMILQAYDAIVGQHTVSQENLPRLCTSLEIDWDQFDVFTHHAADIWRDLVLYVIQSPQFCPRLADSQLPREVQDRLNALLERRGTELLEGQTGLVVDIAQVVQEYGGRPDAGGLPEPNAPLVASSGPQPGSLAAIVLAWLSGVAAADMRTYAPVVASALQAQLAAYEIYEAIVLDQLNQHLSRLMHALGLGRSSALRASALSHVCGRTLRDWGAVSWWGSAAKRES
jgi:hypothetical protein